MRLPSIKTLTAAFGAEKAVRIRVIMEMPPQPCHASSRLELIDDVLGSHGVEHIPHGSNSKSPTIWYCNMGDTYATTVLQVNGSFRVGCWGDIVERGRYA